MEIFLKPSRIPLYTVSPALACDCSRVLTTSTRQRRKMQVPLTEWCCQVRSRHTRHTGSREQLSERKDLSSSTLVEDVFLRGVSKASQHGPDYYSL